MSTRTIGVDRGASIIRGMVVAQAGPFKDGRGEFSDDSLQAIVKLGNAASPLGLRSRFGHPPALSALVGPSSLGTHLGRVRDFFMSSIKTPSGAMIPAVRGDLHLDPTALSSPPMGGGEPLGSYVLRLAANDPDAISSSLVLHSLKFFRREKNGDRSTDSSGEPLPPIWIPAELFAADIVEEGAAVSALLSPEPSDFERIAFCRHRLASRGGSRHATPVGSRHATPVGSLDVELRRRRLRHRAMAY